MGQNSSLSLCLAAHAQLFQVLHENLQADVICKYWSSSIAPTHPPRLVVVRLAGVNLAQEEPGLATTLLGVNVPWHWEPCQQHLLRISHRRLKQLFEVCILRLVLVACCTPLSYCLPVEDQDLEKCVHEQDTIWLYGTGVQQNWLRGARETIAVEDRLDIMSACVRSSLLRQPR